MAVNNHVPQFPEGECENDLGQTIAEIDIILFLREGACIGAPLHMPLTSQQLNYAFLHFIKLTYKALLNRWLLQVSKSIF